jgi:hypothetical protein
MQSSDLSPGHRVTPSILAKPIESQPAEITQLFFSQPLRRQLGLSAERFGEFLKHLRSAKFGPVQFEAFERFVERGETTLSTIEKIDIEIAKSRIIELEVSIFRKLFSEEQAKQVSLQIDNLRKYIDQLDGTIEPAQGIKPKARPQET